MRKQVIDKKGKIYDSIHEFCRQTGCARSHVKGQLKEFGVYKNKAKDIVLKFFNENCSTECDTECEKPTKIDKILEEIKSRYSEAELKLLSKGQGLQDPNLKYPKIHLSGKHHKIGVLSDSHIGSKYSPAEFHYKAFEEFEKQGCECVLHCGDLVEGWCPNRAETQVFELDHIGYSEQRDYAIEIFSKCKLPIYCISGNHDAWYMKMGGDIVKEICDEVPNMTYLGYNEADIEFEDIIIRLFHGNDGSCFTEGTEILTKEKGWVDFKDLTMDMSVATMDKVNHRFEWQKPLEITNQPYQGDVYHFENRKFDFTVTPNHRLWVKSGEKWGAITAEEIYQNWEENKWLLPTTPNDYVQTDFTEYVEIPIEDIKGVRSNIKKPELMKYEGNIYCCSVPNELIYVRNNGRCFFSHNSYATSYRLQKLAESFTGGKKPNILLAGHVHKFCYIFERMIHCVSAPCMQMQTNWMKGKKLPAHTGFLIIEFDADENGVSNFNVKLYPFYA